MLTSFARQEWQRQRFPFDPEGQEFDFDASPDALDISGCSIQPGASLETLSGREANRIAWTIFQPAGSDVTATDFGLLNGSLYRVSGEPQRWVGPTQRTTYDVVLLERWEG